MHLNNILAQSIERGITNKEFLERYNSGKRMAKVAILCKTITNILYLYIGILQFSKLSRDEL